MVVDRPRPALFLRTSLEIRRGARYEYFVTVDFYVMFIVWIYEEDIEFRY